MVNPSLDPPKEDLSRNFDGAWKDSIAYYFLPFFDYFFPDVAALIDRTVPPIDLNSEVRKLYEEGKLGDRIADKLFQVQLLDGTNRVVIFHFEFQNQPDPTLPERMFETSYRLREIKKQKVIGIAVLGDENPNFRPQEYRDEICGCITLYQYHTVKLLDWVGREVELEQSTNPISLLIYTHLLSLQTNKDHQKRYQKKIQMMRNLLKQNVEAETIRRYVNIVDQMLILPMQLEEKMNLELWQNAGEIAMEKLICFERSGFGKGEAAGIQKGEAIGIQKGRQEGRQETLRSIVLKLGTKKYGNPTAEDLEQLNAITDVDQLNVMFDRIDTVSSWSELLK